MVQEQFKIAELKIRLHHLIDKLKSKFSDELVLEISCINYKIECFKNRNNMTNKLIAKIDKESRIFKTAI